jgi:hypothetical protein
VWSRRYALGRHVRPLEDIVMRLSSSVVAPSAAAVLATVLLCGPAASQTATGSATSLPGITVVAPKQVARPHRPKQVANTVISRGTSSTAQTPSAAPDSVQAKIAKLERASSSCNGGCETSFKSGDAPWVGCSLTGPEFTNLSSTCTDTLTYKHYADCVDTKAFLGWDRKAIWWHCSSLLAGGKFRVAELKRSGGLR